MKLTTRELVLGWLTFFALLFAGTYLVCKPHIDSYGDRKAQKAVLQAKVDAATELLDRKKDWETQLGGLRQSVHALPADRPAANYLKKTIGDLATRVSGMPNYSIAIRDRKSGDEKQYGGLYVMPVVCPWDGNTSGLVRLLLDFFEHDVMFDVTELSIVSDGKDKLHGVVTLKCVYTKSGG